MRRIVVALAVACGLATASGCGVADPYAGGLPGPAPTTAGPASTAAGATAPEPGAASTRSRDAVVRRFAEAWSNWTAHDLAAQRRVLASLAVAPLATQLRRDAEQATRDDLERVSTASSTGRLVGVLPQRDGTLVVVTYETAKADGAVHGQPAYDVYVADGRQTPEGWRLSRWEPTA